MNRRYSEKEYHSVAYKILALMIKEGIKESVDSLELPHDFIASCSSNSIFEAPQTHFIEKKVMDSQDDDTILLKSNDTIVRTLSLTKLLEDIR